MYLSNDIVFMTLCIHSFIIHPLCLIIGTRHVSKIHMWLHNCLNIAVTYSYTTKRCPYILYTLIVAKQNTEYDLKL
jgi:hypothetical protein